MNKKITRDEAITDWIMAKFSDKELGPNHSQFSAAQVCDIINTYIREKNSGKIKI